MLHNKCSHHWVESCVLTFSAVLASVSLLRYVPSSTEPTMVSPLPAFSCVVKERRRGCFTFNSESRFSSTSSWGLKHESRRETCDVQDRAVFFFFYCYPRFLLWLNSYMVLWRGLNGPKNCCCDYKDFTVLILGLYSQYAHTDMLTV